MKILGSMTLLCSIAIVAIGQDPLKTLPNAYRLEFENEWVKVVRVHYAPHEKLPAHDHTQMASAYVYLNDGGPVVFNHIDKDYGAVTRPATKAGSFRVYRSLQEHHEVENRSDLPSDFLRVEFKTEPLNEKSLKGRYFREEYPVGENFQRVQFENEQIRITRLVCAPRRILELSAAPGEPMLLVALSPSMLKASESKGKSKGHAELLKMSLGQAHWVPSGSQAQFENVDRHSGEFLRFDLKTRPLSSDELDKNPKHEHTK